MIINTQVSKKPRSPLQWMGGKSSSAKYIIAAFPPHDRYDVFVDVMGGAANVLIQKPIYPGQLEVYNDLNADLVNFWKVARSQTEALQEWENQHIYSQLIYQEYRESLKYHDPSMSNIERAGRWFYVNKGCFSGNMFAGWSHSNTAKVNRPRAFRSATELLTTIAERFRYVQVDNRDFAAVIRSYQSHSALLYLDPPYIGCEQYYAAKVHRTPLFTQEDHGRLAQLLNESPAFVALSYYEHPLLEEWYPVSKWRRVEWNTKRSSGFAQAEHTEESKRQKKDGKELLLLNYPAQEELFL